MRKIILVTLETTAFFVIAVRLMILLNQRELWDKFAMFLFWAIIFLGAWFIVWMLNDLWNLR